MFTKGAPGRPQGAKNKLTKDVRTRIGIFVDHTWKDMVAIFKKMPDEDKADFYLRLLKYAVPELKAVDVTTDGESINTKTLNIEVASKEDAEALTRALSVGLEDCP